jgi:hypothetical protein
MLCSQPDGNLHLNPLGIIWQSIVLKKKDECHEKSTPHMGIKDRKQKQTLFKYNQAYVVVVFCQEGGPKPCNNTTL